MKYETVLYEKKEKVGYVTLNRPKKGNAISLKMVNELLEIFRKIADERDVHCVVVKGAGKVFSSGHDLNQILHKKPIDVRRLFLESYKLVKSLRELPQPVIAQVHGVATAAGCQFVAACDLAIAEENTLFALPGIKMACFCSTPIVFVSRAIGRKRSFEMGITGDYITAKQALEWGLVNRVVALKKLDETVTKLSQKIAGFSLYALETAKKMFYQQLNMEDFQALLYGTEIITLNLTNEEAQEKIELFLEK